MLERQPKQQPLSEGLRIRAQGAAYKLLEAQTMQHGEARNKAFDDVFKEAFAGTTREERSAIEALMSERARELARRFHYKRVVTPDQRRQMPRGRFSHMEKVNPLRQPGPPVRDSRIDRERLFGPDQSTGHSPDRGYDDGGIGLIRPGRRTIFSPGQGPLWAERFETPGGFGPGSRGIYRGGRGAMDHA